MRLNVKIFLITALTSASVFLSGCATSKDVISTKEEKKALEKEYSVTIMEIMERIESGVSEKSVTNDIDPIISYFEKTYTKEGRIIYSARNKKETDYLLALAKEKKPESIYILPDFYADAYFLKGYYYTGEKKYTEAGTFIEKAIEMTPTNSQYLSALGHVLHAEKKWEEAVTIFEKAEKAAEEYSSENSKEEHLTRAMRGKAFSLIELGKLEEAEEIYKKCLKIDSDDRVSNNELKYIKQLKEKREKEEKETPVQPEKI